jgi:hypothetical protein
MTAEELDILYREVNSRPSRDGGKILTDDERARLRQLFGLHGPDRVADPMAFREWAILNDIARAESGTGPGNDAIARGGQ